MNGYSLYRNIYNKLQFIQKIYLDTNTKECGHKQKYIFLQIFLIIIIIKHRFLIAEKKPRTGRKLTCTVVV